MATQINAKIQRRYDYCPWCKKLCQEVTDFIERHATIEDVFDLVADRCNELIQGKTEYENLILRRKVCKDYKFDTFYLKIYANYLRGIGTTVGDQVSFVVVDNGAPLLGDRLRPSYSRPDPLDYSFYIRQASCPLDKLVSSSF